MDIAEPAVHLSEVSKSFLEGGERHRVLDKVSLQVPEGTCAILLGRSGSGKSTLLNLMGGLEAPDSGTVKVAGRQLADLSEKQRTLFRRSRIGYVFQFFNLIPTLTVLENVLLKPDLNGDLAKGRERGLALLEEVGLADRRDSWPDRLSGGEQQRVAIAAALAHEPDLVLADEPTGNLDLGTGQQIIELLDRLTRARGRTLVMATHSSDVMGIADQVLTVSDGALQT